jgi:glycosyltransferase involved in cell wall biosynthesis
VRILYLADIRFPLERANGIQTMQTCHALAARGHAVTLAVRGDTAQPPRDAFRFYGVPPLPALTIAARDVAGPEPMRRLRYLGRAVLDASLLIAPDVVLTRDLGAAALLLTLPRGVRPVVVYESHGYAPSEAADRHARLSGAAPASAAKRARLDARERRVWREADGYATITAALAAELADRFGPRDVAVVPDGVALDEACTPAPRVSSGASTVVYAGHLYPWKGVGTLLDALPLLPGVQATVVGGHPKEPDLERLQDRAAQLGVGDRVRFTGLVEPPCVAALLGEADVLVLPNVQTTISAAYTSPLKLFEYMAAGRPIVASDLPALREVVDEESAVLVEPGRPDALAAGIARLLDDRGLGHRLAARARLLVEEYSWAKRAERLERLMEEAITRHQGPGRA